MEAWEKPARRPWWPSPHGAKDQAGNSNYITAEKIMKSLRIRVTGVPHSALASGEPLPDPDREASTNILMLHPKLVGPIAEQKIPHWSGR